MPVMNNPNVNSSKIVSRSVGLVFFASGSPRPSFAFLLKGKVILPALVALSFDAFILREAHLLRMAQRIDTHCIGNKFTFYLGLWQLFGLQLSEVVLAVAQE